VLRTSKATRTRLRGEWAIRRAARQWLATRQAKKTVLCPLLCGKGKPMLCCPHTSQSDVGVLAVPKRYRLNEAIKMTTTIHSADYSNFTASQPSVVRCSVRKGCEPKPGVPTFVEKVRGGHPTSGPPHPLCPLQSAACSSLAKQSTACLPTPCSEERIGQL
jgi:hypothetical protein